MTGTPLYAMQHWKGETIVRLLRTISILGIITVPTAAWADGPPFGLHWGDTVQALSDRGVVLQIEQSSPTSVQAAATALRIKPAQPGSVEIVVNKAFGLQRIIWTSTEIEDTAFGTQGIAAYQQRKRAMTKDYGTPRYVAEEMWAEFYSSPDQFYECLAADGCGTYLSQWRTYDGDLILQLVAAKAPHRGQLKITYDGPRWDDIKAGNTGKKNDRATTR